MDCNNKIRNNSSYNYCSINTLLHRRNEGRCSSVQFTNTIWRQLQPASTISNNNDDNNNPVFRPDPYTRIFVTGNKNSNGRQSIVQTTTMDLCNQSRFLLTGNQRGMISIFDLSPWGKSTRQSLFDTNTDRQSPTSIHEPIQQAFVPLAVNNNVTNNNPRGYGTSLAATRWYPIDSGAFLTGSSNGTIHIWDTNEMIPVLDIQPYRFEKSTTNTNYSSAMNRAGLVAGSAAILSGMEPCPHATTNTSLTATCSIQSNTIKLIDLRSGSSSHSLYANGARQNSSSSNGGVSTVCWSPINPYVLASASNYTNVVNQSSSIISLWDIRKPGSLACLTVLDQDYQPPIGISTAYYPDGSHWRTIKQLQRQQEQRRQNNKEYVVRYNKKIKKDVDNKSNKSTSSSFLKGIAPNNYSITTHSSETAISHTGDGGISRLKFHPSGQYMVSATYNGDIKIWDLRTAGHCIPRRFIGPDGGKPMGLFSSSSSSSSSSNNHNHCSAPLILTEHASRFHVNGCSTSNSNDCTIIWTSKGCHIYGYSMEDGGKPRHILKGHLGNIVVLIRDNVTGRLLTSGTDGLILVWNKTQKRRQLANIPKDMSALNRRHNYATASNNTYQKRRIQDIDSW